MQYSDVSGKSGIIQDITFLLGIDINGYPLLDRTRNANERYKMVWGMIFEAYGGWKWQDDNENGIPYADQTITSGTGIYSLPTGALTINMVEIKNSGGTYEILVPITQEEFKKMGADARFTSNAVPRYYLLYEDQIQLLPVPNYTVADSGIRIYFDRGVTVFASTDTTKVPGFDVNFHRMLSVGAALDYAIARGLKNKIRELQSLWTDYEGRLKDFYSKRYFDRFPPSITTGDLLEEFR